jgi:two-component system, OmpR family, sensor histidine kinase KdpD
MSLDENVKKNLIQVASEEAERLNHLISNLLDSSRIESGSIKLQRQFSDVQEILNAALENLASSTVTHPVKINIPSDLALVSVDFGLITHVLVNLLDNAFKYSPDGSPVEVTARELEDEVEVEIADRGIGIPEADLAHVFDRFYRVQRAERIVGTGLGLSICKGIVEAHNGSIAAGNRSGGGTVIRLRLPIEEGILGR